MMREWLIRTDYRHGRTALTWVDAFRLQSEYDTEELIALLGAAWRDDWLQLSVDRAGFVRYSDFVRMQGNKEGASELVFDEEGDEFCDRYGWWRSEDEDLTPALFLDGRPPNANRDTGILQAPVPGKAPQQ